MQHADASGGRRTGAIFWVAATLVWMLFVYANAYPNLVSGLSNPTWPELPTAFTPNAAWIALPVAALFLIAARGVGMLLVKRAKVDWGSPWHADLVATLLGFALLSLATLPLGAARLLGRVPTLSLWVLALILGALETRTLLVRLRGAGGRPRPKPSAISIACAGLLFVFGVFGAISALAPETSPDGLSAHLFATAQYAAAGRFIDLPSYEAQHVPELAHLLFLPLWHVLGDIGPKALVFVQGGLIVAFAALMAADVSGRRAGWVAAVIAASTPALLSSSGMAYTDVPVALFGSAALWVALRYGATSHGAMLAGALAGAAAGTKYLGVFIVVLAAGLSAWSSARSGDGFRHRATLASIARVVLCAGLVCGPFYLKNWIALGNPFYPLFASVFGSYHFSAEEIAGIVGHAGSQGAGRNLPALALLPWNLTVHGELFQGCLGGLFLALAPLMLAGSTHRTLCGLGLAVLGFLVAFAFAQHTLRWFLLAIPLLAALLACSLEQLAQRGVPARFREVFTGIVFATAILHLPFFHKAWLKGWFLYQPRVFPTKVVVGGESRSEYLARLMPAYPLVARFDADKKPESHVIAMPEWSDVGQLATWLGDRLLRNFTAVHVNIKALSNGANTAPEAIYEVYRANGITHLMVQQDPGDPRVAMLDEESAFGLRYLTLIARSGPFGLFRIEPKQTPTPVFLDLLARLQSAQVEPKDGPEPLVRKHTISPPGAESKQTLTILSGGSAAFAVQTLPMGAKFQAELAMPFASGDGAIALLEFAEHKHVTTLLRQSLKPAGGWVLVDLDLTDLGGRSGSLVLRTHPGPAGNAVGDWVGWARPRVVAPADAIERAVKSYSALDVISAFASAQKSPSGQEPLVRTLELDHRGRPEATLTVLGGGWVSYELEVPGGLAALEADVTLPVTGGDGAVAVARFDAEGFSRELIRLPLTPPADPKSQSWHPVRVDLSVLAGRRGRLVFTTETGPTGNGVADWVSWAGARVVGLRGVDRRLAVDLYASFDAAKKLPAKEVRKFQFARAGQMREAIVTSSRATITFDVTVPMEKPRFEAAVAMSLPNGDGAAAVLQFVHDGRTAELLREALQPAPAKQAQQADPGWKVISVDLSKFAGRRGALILTTDPGPKGDAVGDWVGWTDPRITFEPAATAQRVP